MPAHWRQRIALDIIANDMRMNINHGHRTTCFIATISLLGLVTAASNLAQAETYPARPVRIIVPYGVGGIADVTMRMVAHKLSERLGQQFLIDNRPSAGGVVAMQAAAVAAPDGYTLAMIGGGLTIARSLFKSLPYDITVDFVPISTTAFYGIIVATKAGSPLTSVAEIIGAARKNPGRLNFGTINPGSTQHLAAELFRIAAGIEVTMIPYKTTPDVATGLLRGDVDVAFEYFPGFQAPIHDRQIVIVATTGRERAANMPSVPTIGESGLPNYEVTSWNGLAAPAGVAPEIVTLLSRAVNEALRSPDIQAISRRAGMDARGSTSEDLRARIKSDVAKWADVIEKAAIEKK
ncbi:MAG: tripartite tricarboxylate transporter substrate binding protein [Betaproteobacteria bacterium]|nr:MAG: tripartite tricarboxylate transporter substrate binding protein [Betaproteobacteria bacterium]TMI11022.1 MAG: tripartite tricarboxylate transporter substrate binding protein [Betaproteobacteria bacterium]